jgi:hypothetical protein
VNNIDVYTTTNLPSPDSIGKGGVIFVIGEGLRVSDGDAWLSETVPTGQVLAVADADALTVGGIKIGTTVTISTELLAASVDKWVFIADRAYEVVQIEEIHSVVGGSSAAVKFRKVTDVSAPGAAAGATVKELATAGFDLTATANTTLTATLSATPADYRLADGDKIGADFSGTLTGLVGIATLTLKAL